MGMSMIKIFIWVRAESSVLMDKKEIFLFLRMKTEAVMLSYFMHRSLNRWLSMQRNRLDNKIDKYLLQHLELSQLIHQDKLQGLMKMRRLLYHYNLLLLMLAIQNLLEKYFLKLVFLM
jgi:hypothetical protein